MIVRCVLLSGAVAVIPMLFVMNARAADDPDPPPAFTPEVLDAMMRLPGDLGPLSRVPVPKDNPQSDVKVRLGRRLFFDPQLSLDGSLACKTCHDPDKAYSDGRKRAIGFGQHELPRRSPTILNSAHSKHLFWDGRAGSLEAQAKGPITSKAEMNMTSEAELKARLAADPEYRRAFDAVFRSGPSLDRVAKAIAAFERTLVTRDSKFDRYAAGDRTALDDQEKRGLILFVGKAACSECHKGENFSDGRFHNLGLLPGETESARDLGRFMVTKAPADRGAFKTPTLRNVALSAPYGHNGGFATLEDVVDFYDRGGGPDPNRSPLLFELGLTDEEKRDLIAFLRSLSGTLPELPADETGDR
jgi:cytochrome c peroxidase